MSLLLEALKRAEDDARKRRLADAVAPTPVVATEPEASVVPSAPAPLVDVPLSLASDPLDFASFSLEDMEVAAPAQSAELEMEKREPTPPLAEMREGTNAPTTEPSRPATDPSLAPKEPASAPSGSALNIGIPDRATTAAPSPKPTGAPAPTARQAKAAINAMVAPVGKSKSRTRQFVLAGIALLLLVPLAGVFLFGDSLFQTPSLVNVAATTAASTSVPQAAAGNVTVQAVPTTVGAGSLTAALPEPVANLAEAPAPKPAVTAPPRAARPTSAPPPSQNIATTAVNSATKPAQSPPLVPLVASAPRPAESDKPPVTLVPQVNKTASLLESAYASFQAGGTEKAQKTYREVIALDPNQIDAWLGLAVIAHAAKRTDPAIEYYKRVLRLDPNNGTALAGLNGLVNPAQAPGEESRLRELLATTPQSPELNNALGLMMASQARWPEAQQLFFKARSSAPLEPQYAFNLAISLDRMRKTELARQQYAFALELVNGKRPGFDVEAAKARLVALSNASASGVTP